MLPARVPLDQRADPAAYELVPANVLFGGRPMSISVDRDTDAGGGLVLVEGTSVGGTFRIWEAAHPFGPWVLRTPDEQRLAGCVAPPDVVDFCHALIAQPDLSSPGHLAVSHYAVADQHVRLTQVALAGP